MCATFLGSQVIRITRRSPAQEVIRHAEDVAPFRSLVDGCNCPDVSPVFRGPVSSRIHQRPSFGDGHLPRLPQTNSHGEKQCSNRATAGRALDGHREPFEAEGRNKWKPQVLTFSRLRHFKFRHARAPGSLPVTLSLRHPQGASLLRHSLQALMSLSKVVC